MIKFEKIKNEKEYNISLDEKKITSIKLTPSSITNKFYVVTSFIESMSEYIGSEFDNWFINLINEYNSIEESLNIEEEINPDKPTGFSVLKNNLNNIIDFVNRYIDYLDIDFSKFVDEKKSKKNSILFRKDEIKLITRLSGYLKVYSIFFNSDNLRLDNRMHRVVYNILSDELSSTDVINKVFNIIKTRTFRYNLTDRYMWDYIKMVQCKSIDVHVIEIFNFIMNSILVLCETDKNPITYFIGVVEESVKWFLRSVYKGSIIYDDSISTEDIQGVNVNNLKTYCYNDTLGRLKNISYEQAYTLLNIDSSTDINNEDVPDTGLIDLHKRLKDIKYVSPLCDFLVYPILSRLTDIPYDHFKTISPEHSAVLSIYLQNILEKVFSGEFMNLFSLLSYYPEDQPILATTYKLKNLSGKGGFVNIQNELDNFFGFKTKILCGKLLSSFVGRIPRSNFTHIITGKKMGGIPTSKIELEVIKFYSYLFAGRLESQIKQMRWLLNSSF